MHGTSGHSLPPAALHIRVARWPGRSSGQGFDYITRLRSAWHYMPSAREHPDIVTTCIEEELASSCVIGPLPHDLVLGMHVNRMGMVPKGHTPGKRRLIINLPFPEGEGVNAGIDLLLCLLRYTTVDKMARILNRWDTGPSSPSWTSRRPIGLCCCTLMTATFWGRGPTMWTVYSHLSCGWPGRYSPPSPTLQSG